MGLIRVLAVLVAASVTIDAQDLFFGAALGTFLASTLDVHPPWVAQMAGRTLTAFAAAGGRAGPGQGLGAGSPRDAGRGVG